MSAAVEGNVFSLPPSPKNGWAGESCGWRRTRGPASGWGLAFEAPTWHIYAYICWGVAADVSSQPALPISKNNLGRLDTRLLRALHEIPLSAFLNAHHSVLTKANQSARAPSRQPPVERRCCKLADLRYIACSNAVADSCADQSTTAAASRPL